MSKVVQNAANRSLSSMQSFQARAQQIQSQARQGMFDAGIATAGGVAALSYPLKMAAGYERLRVSMVSLTGSQVEGARAYRDVIRLASDTPLQLDEVAKVTTMMIGYGSSAREATSSVKLLGDITALTNGQLENAIVAYGQARQEGKMLTRDLRQFINAGVPIVSILQNVLGAETNVFKMAEEGRITFSLLQEALEKSTAAGGKFENGLGTLAKTGEGTWVRLTDTLARFAAVFGNSVLPALKSFGEALIPILDSTAKFITEHDTLAKVLMWGVIAFTSIAAAAVVYNAAIWLMSTAVMTATSATTLFIFKHTGLTFLLKLLARRLVLIRFAFVMAGEAGLFMTNVTKYGLVPAIWMQITALNAWIGANTALSASIFGIPILGWILAVVAAIIALGVAIYKNWDAIVAFFDGMWQKFKDFLPKAKSWGVNLIQSIKDGIVSAAPTLFNAIDGVMKFTRGFFPSSPAKRGAFKDIQRIKIIEQVAKNIKPNSLASAVGNATRGAVGSIGGGSSSPAIAPVNSGGGGSVQVNYSPSITIGGGGGEAEKQSFMAMLERHKDEVLKLVNETQRTQQRRAYA